MFRKYIFIIFITCVSDSLCAVDSLYDAGKELWKLHSIIDNLKWENIDSIRDIAKLFTGHRVLDKTLSNQVKKLDGQLLQLEKSVNPKVIRYSWRSLSSDILLVRSLDRFDLLISSIDTYYEKFHEFMNEASTKVEPLQDLTPQIVMDIQEWMDTIRSIASEGDKNLPEHQNLIYSITGYATTFHNTICDNPAVGSKILIDLLKILMIAEIKSNIVIAIANIDRYVEMEEWKIQNAIIRHKFQGKFASYVKLVEQNTELIDSWHARACDPEDGIWIRNQDFYELEGSIQTTIFRYHWGKCKFLACNTLRANKHLQCGVQLYDDRSGCSTSSDNCFYLNSVQACVLKNGPYRFQYLNSSELGSFGTNFNCQKDGYMINDGSIWNWTHAACACNCYNNENKISLVLMQSRKRLNMVIIGLRFFRKDNTLYIQPREGKLQADGYIRKNSCRWIPVPNNGGGTNRQTIDKLNKIFFLDDLRLPPNHVLTGIKFNKVTRQALQGFSIQIFGVQFDYKTGKLNLRTDDEVFKRPVGNIGEEILFTPVSPVLGGISQTVVTPGTNTYIVMTKSRLNEDVGQSTLPFFDAVPIAPKPSFLNGVGIFHKGASHDSGFISLRVYGIPYKQYFTDFTFLHVHEGKVIFDD